MGGHGMTTHDDVRRADRARLLEKLERAAAPLRREGWSAVEVRPEGVPDDEARRWTLIPPHCRLHTPAEKRRIAALAAARNKVAARIRHEFVSNLLLWRQMEAYEDEIAALQDAVQEWDAATRARCKAVVLLSSRGVQVIRGIAIATPP